jgi:c-di-GMP-binding flagellar brake protein YcgR
MPERKVYKITVLGTSQQKEYEVSSVYERFRLLDKICQNKEPITLYLGKDSSGKSINYVTKILAADKEHDFIVFERAQDEKLNQQLGELTELKCASIIDTVPIEFIIKDHRLAKFQDEIIYTSPLPETLVRVQRRQFYRVDIPLSLLASCTLHPGAANERDLDIADISLGGIGFTFQETPPVQFKIGDTFEECEIRLPGTSSFTVDLQVKNILTKMINNKKIIIVGLEFLELPEATLNQIQRFIYETERERLKSRNN